MATCRECAEFKNCKAEDGTTDFYSMELVIGDVEEKCDSFTYSKAKPEGDVVVSLTITQAKNLAEFIEMNLMDVIRNDTDIDGIGWLCDMCDIYRKVGGKPW